MYARRLVLMIALPAAIIAATGYLAFKGSSPADADGARLPILLRKLGDSDPDVRREAETELRTLGPKAVPPLREAAISSDRALADRASRLLRELAPEPAPEIARPPEPAPEPSEPPRPVERRPVEVILQSAEAQLGLGEPIRFYVRLRNDGPEPVIVARHRVLRYSAFAWFEVEDDAGKIARHPSELLRLPISESPIEFIPVAPGTTLDLYAGQGDGRTEIELPDRPGVYRIRYVYDASAGSPYAEAVLASSLPAPLPRGRLISNTLVVRVTD